MQTSGTEPPGSAKPEPVADPTAPVGDPAEPPARTAGSAERATGSTDGSGQIASPADGRSSQSQAARDGHCVAILLAAAAIVAAIITARATIKGSEATGLWQQSVGEEQKRGAFLLEGARYAYGDVGDMAFFIATEQVRADELQAASATAPADIAPHLLMEAQVHAQVAEAIRTSSVIGTEEQYQLPSGGYDLQRFLADERLELGDDLRIDPLATVEEGDRASEHGRRLIGTMALVGLSFLLGSLAQSMTTRRRLLLLLGWAALAVAVLMAVAVETAA